MFDNCYHRFQRTSVTAVHDVACIPILTSFVTCVINVNKNTNTKNLTISCFSNNPLFLRSPATARHHCLREQKLCPFAKDSLARNANSCGTKRVRARVWISGYCQGGSFHMVALLLTGVSLTAKSQELQASRSRQAVQPEENRTREMLGEKISPSFPAKHELTFSSCPVSRPP